MQMGYYPFDRQTCRVCLGSTASTKDQIIHHSAREVLDKSHSSEGGQWILLHAEGVDGSYQNYSSACVEMNLQRRSLYYVINLFFPTLIICLMNTVSLFFRLEDEPGQMDLVGVGQTTLLSLGVILLNVADQTPKGSAVVSLLGKSRFDSIG